jgi:hypothetical protein
VLNANVLRKQYAIGHGGLHAGRIVVTANVSAAQASIAVQGDEDGAGAISTLLMKFYVYDCGSVSRDAFDRSLKSHNRLTGMRTDILSCHISTLTT